ncbi:MAG: response regulator transcription factor [Eubacterium sp.]|nr:response regulator transcription factor [Eubacterium sp.]
MANILVVDDDKAILTMIRRILEKDGHNVTWMSDSTAVNEIRLDRFDLILLDVMMPGKDGFVLCEELRGNVDCPILFLTAKSEESSLVYGLEKGADDYICKPFGAAELRARVAAHLRRETREHFVGLSFAGSRFSLPAKQLSVNGEEIALTKAEYLICEFLARNHGQVFSREQIYEKVFGFDGESSDATIATHIKNIRIKLDKYHYSPIKTVWGIGYKWED